MAYEYDSLHNYSCITLIKLHQYWGKDSQLGLLGIELSEKLADGLTPVLTILRAVGVDAELCCHRYVRRPIIEEEGLLGLHLSFANHALEDPAIRLH